MAIRHHIPARMRVWAGSNSGAPWPREEPVHTKSTQPIGSSNLSSGARPSSLPSGESDPSVMLDSAPAEPIRMVPRADLYGGRVLLTGAGYDPEAAAIAPVEAGEFDRPTTIAGWKSYFNDLAGKPPE